MKLCIVLYFKSDNDDTEIFGIFSSEEKARDELKKREISSHCFSINEVFIDCVLI